MRLLIHPGEQVVVAPAATVAAIFTLSPCSAHQHLPRRASQPKSTDRARDEAHGGDVALVACLLLAELLSHALVLLGQKIADYPFTNPCTKPGVVRAQNGQSFVCADVQLRRL